MASLENVAMRIFNSGAGAHMVASVGAALAPVVAEVAVAAAPLAIVAAAGYGLYKLVSEDGEK